MKYKFNFQTLLAAAAIVMLSAGCQSTPNNTAANNSPEVAATTASDVSTPSAGGGGGSRWGADLNLTDAQKTQMKQIREQTKAKVVALLTPDQQAKFQASTANANGASMKALSSLNLTDAQKQQIKDLQKAQRQQMQAILTPDQLAKLKEHDTSKGQSGSN